MKSILIPVIILVAIAGLSGCDNCASDAQTESAAAARATTLAADAAAREEAAAALEAQRLAALWTYYAAPAGVVRQVTAAINSTSDVDTDATGPNVVQLVFRDHASWGRSSYLVLQAGDFDCYARCNVNVTVDDAAPGAMRGLRPKTDEAIAMFITDWRALWGLTAGAKRITIEFPVKAGGTRTASFDVGGLDRSKLPGWD